MIIEKFDPDTGLVKTKQNIPLRSISVVLAKPTKSCNADCSYCFAKPYDKDRWSFSKFKEYFDKIEPYLLSPTQWIWHGGEPMMMGVDFFYKAEEYAKKSGVKINFSMQSNLTLYNDDKWLTYIKEDIDSRISTSYDIDEISRTINGSADKYNSRFFNSIDSLMSNGISPFMIGVYDDSNVDMVDEMYDLSKEYKNRYGVGISFRINPKIEKSNNEFESVFQLTPKKYGEVLVRLLDRWLADDDADFNITPLDSFISFYFSYGEYNICPWTNACVGKFINIEPNGDIYNCDDSVHFSGFDYKFGNLLVNSMDEILKGNVIEAALSKSKDVAEGCMRCEFFYACKGGCGALKNLNGKFGTEFYPYCETNKMVFQRIKELAESGFSEQMKNKIVNNN